MDRSEYLKKGNLWDAIDLVKGRDLHKVVDEIEEIVNKRLRGEIHPERFKSFRLNYGTYGVRHYSDGMHMQRIKIPGGFLFAKQLRSIAEVVRSYAGSGVAHITTRQNMQLHYVKLEDVPTVLRSLADVGLTTREACGNSVRNVTCSPYTGICKDEVFDVLPYAIFLARHFLFHPLTTTLPRKFKVSFSECEHDHALSRINDIGAVAQVRNGQKGFRVYAAGGLSFSPMTSQLLVDFIPVEDFYPLAEAILRVFHKFGDKERLNKNKARMKFLARRIGWEKFKELVMKEFEITRRHRKVSEELHRFLSSFPVAEPTSNGRAGAHRNTRRRTKPTYPLPERDEAFQRFLEFSVMDQKQEGFAALILRPPLGNLTPEEMLAVADLSERYGEGFLHLTIDQNVMIPWIEKPFLYDVYVECKERGFYDNRFGLRQIVSCPGAYSCRLAVTHPYNLAEHIGDRINDLEGLRIHISGCPNACGQHQVGDIGFYGASLKLKDKLAPYYVLLLGGDPFDQRDRLGKVMAKIPVHNAHKVVEAIVKFWKENRRDGERFYQLLDRTDKKDLLKLIAPYTKPDEKQPIYSEPGMDSEFKMEAESRGECAGSILDLVAISLFEAKRNIYECEDHFKDKDYQAIKEKCLASIELCCKMFIELRRGKGSAAEEGLEIVLQFEEEILPEDWLCHDFSGITEQYLTFRDAPATQENVDRLYKMASTFVADCDDAFLRLKPDMEIAECERKLGAYSYK